MDGEDKVARLASEGGRICRTPEKEMATTNEATMSMRQNNSEALRQSIAWFRKDVQHLWL